MGLGDNSHVCGTSTESLANVSDKVDERPLYFWLKSFAEKEIRKHADVSAFVSSTALNTCLEYIGISPENEQSSLHLSAIFEEDSIKNKYPTHYESETKSRIQSLNRVFIELKSFFEDRFSQLVAIRPPNSVHITSSCSHCSVVEFEKLLFLLLGAAIQGTQKQDTIRTIKRFPTNIQESLIECIKLIADNPELLNVKSWNEFQTLSPKEQKNIYDSLLSLVRKLICERNELAQNQLITDYFAGFTNCDQKPNYNYNNYYAMDLERNNSEDTRLSSNMRQLREQLVEKSDLLQECREEIEEARNRIQELELEVNEMKQKHRAMKKARDELDALREGHEKASRLEIELSRLKAKLEESELAHDRAEALEIENRNWQVKHDILLDQISFLSFEKSSRDNSYDQINAYTGILDGLSESLKDFKDENERTFFDTDDEEEDQQSVKENLKEQNQINKEEEKEGGVDEEEETKAQGMNTSTSTIQPDSSPEAEQAEEIYERPINLDLSQTESIDPSGSNLIASTPKSSLQQHIQLKSQEVQTPSRIKRRRRGSSLLNMKRTRKAIIIPIPSGQKMPAPTDIDKISENSTMKEIQENSSHTIQFYKVYSVDRRKGSSKPKKFKSPIKTPTSEKQVVPNLDNGGNEADEELSISPTGNPNLSDLDSNNDAHATDNDSEIYFVCSPQNTTGTNTPRKSHFGTTTAFPISNGTTGLRRTEFVFDPQNLSNIHFNLQNPNHSNHMTIYSRHLNDSNSPSLSPSSSTTTTTTPKQPNNIASRPYSKITHDIQIGGPSSSRSGSEDRDEENDPLNAFTFGDYNIQLNLRNSIKPALINKISTLSSTCQRNQPDLNHNFSNQYSSPRDPPYIETSSEEDGSIWYEYGCV